MKIPLRIVTKPDREGKEYIYCALNAILECRKPRFFQRDIEFMIDTGATLACVLIEKDAKLLGIPFDSGGVKKNS